MDIWVCVKRVPMTQEVDLRIDASGKEIFNSGEVSLSAPTRDVAVPVDLDGVQVDVPGI